MFIDSALTYVQLQPSSEDATQKMFENMATLRRTNSDTKSKAPKPFTGWINTCNYIKVMICLRFRVRGQ